MLPSCTVPSMAPMATLALYLHNTLEFSDKKHSFLHRSREYLFVLKYCLLRWTKHWVPYDYLTSLTPLHAWPPSPPRPTPSTWSPTWSRSPSQALRPSWQCLPRIGSHRATPQQTTSRKLMSSVHTNVNRPYQSQFQSACLECCPPGIQYMGYSIHPVPC